jgi:hypothetical protein
MSVTVVAVVEGDTAVERLMVAAPTGVPFSSITVPVMVIDDAGAGVGAGAEGRGVAVGLLGVLHADDAPATQTTTSIHILFMEGLLQIIKQSDAISPDGILRVSCRQLSSGLAS